MRKTDKILNEINTRELEVLESIYKYRCLTQEQIYKLHYKYSKRTGKIVSDSYSKVKIKELLKLQAIQEEEHIDEKYYHLTNLGVRILRNIGALPTNVYLSKKNKIIKGYLTSGDLKLSRKLLNHQKNLVDFVIDFRNNHEDLSYKYYDEKDILTYKGIRPDGLLSLKNYDVFLEMDMSTESKKQLIDKWNNYREFLNSYEFEMKNKKIVMLFIIEGKHQHHKKFNDKIIQKKINQRIKIVKKTISDTLFDVIKKKFDIYVGSKEDMLSLLKHKIIPLNINNTYSREEEIKNVLSKSKNLDFSMTYFYKLFTDNKKLPLYKHPREFRFFIFKQKYNENGISIAVDNNNNKLEFFLDDYYFEPVSVGLKASMLQNINVFYKEYLKRGIRYIIVGKSEEQIYNDIKLYNLENIEDVYFTTLNRLKKYGFPNALFKITATGNLYSFIDKELSNIDLEKNMRNLFNNRKE